MRSGWLRRAPASRARMGMSEPCEISLGLGKARAFPGFRRLWNQ